MCADGPPSRVLLSTSGSSSGSHADPSAALSLIPSRARRQPAGGRAQLQTGAERSHMVLMTNPTNVAGLISLVGQLKLQEMQQQARRGKPTRDPSIYRRYGSNG